MHRSPLHAVVLLLALPALASAQAAEVRVRENVRAAPGGEVIAVVDPGTGLQVVGRRESWLEVALEGWIWMRSLQVTDRGGYDLVVSASEGENLRPSGPWRWTRDPRRRHHRREPASRVLARASGRRGDRGSWRRVGRSRDPGGGPPGGDTLAHAGPGTALQVISRQGSWARVRTEGWAWLPEEEPASESTVPRPAPTELAAAPDRYRGSVVGRELQFLSLERAERIRTDFFEGEPFLLTRHPSGSYVYVALPPERMSEALTLAPLERITVVGRVRAPASALTGSPILDLLELERTGTGR